MFAGASCGSCRRRTKRYELEPNNDTLNPMHGVLVHNIMVQLTGECVRIKTDIIRAEFKRGGVLQDLLLNYTHALITQSSQSAVCNRFHTRENRLCPCLFSAQH